MIEKLTLVNFQAHEKLVIHLDPQITTIVGASDVGKSAVVRALAWVLYNQPSGADFKRHNTERVRVVLRLDGGQRVMRARDKANLYTLGKEVYKAFGAEVPAPLQGLLKVSPINLQQQFDPPFWFAETSGEVSRRLNEIVDLGVIDHALGEVASILRKATTKVEISQERLSDLEAKQATYEILSSFQEGVAKAQAKEREGQGLLQRKNKLKILGDTANEMRKKVKDCTSFIEAAQPAAAWGARLEVVRKRFFLLSALTKLGEHQTKSSHFEAPSLAIIEKAQGSIEQVRLRFTKLDYLINTYINQRDDARLKTVQAKEVHDKFHQTLKDLKICPLCGSATS